MRYPTSTTPTSNFKFQGSILGALFQVRFWDLGCLNILTLSVEPSFMIHDSKPRFKIHDSKPRFKIQDSRFKIQDSKPRFNLPFDSSSLPNTTQLAVSSRQTLHKSRLSAFKDFNNAASNFNFLSK